MPPRHPFITAEQQRVQSLQTAMAAGRETSRYSDQLVAAAFAAMTGMGVPPVREASGTE